MQSTHIEIALHKACLQKRLKHTIKRRTIMRTILTLLLLLSPLKAFAHSYSQKGVASYYSHYEDGRETADGQRYSPYRYTAASKTIKLGTTIKVVNIRNGRSVYLLVNDRGPY